MVVAMRGAVAGVSVWGEKTHGVCYEMFLRIKSVESMSIAGSIVALLNYTIEGCLLSQGLSNGRRLVGGINVKHLSLGKLFQRYNGRIKIVIRKGEAEKRRRPEAACGEWVVVLSSLAHLHRSSRDSRGWKTLMQVPTGVHDPIINRELNYI